MQFDSSLWEVSKTFNEASESLHKKLSAQKTMWRIAEVIAVNAAVLMALYVIF